MKTATIRGIEYHLPDQVLSSAKLAAEFPEWSVEKIDEKTGIGERHIAAEGETSADLACAAATKLFASGVCDPASIDYVLFCTQSPDYILPTSACLLQERLGIPTTAGALDYNLGCSGFVVGLGLAKGLVETGQASRVLLLTGETYSKFLHPRDKSVRTIFGDAASATLVEAGEGVGPESSIGPFVYGTDGSGAGNLIVPTGGAREARTTESGVAREEEGGNWRSHDNLYMNGAEIFNFTLRTIPKCVKDLLTVSATSMDDIDLFVFHQANQYILDHLRKKMHVPEEKFFMAMRHCGNTVSSSIPIALKHALEQGRLKLGDRVMLVGFGVGYSWAATLVRWV